MIRVGLIALLLVVAAASSFAQGELERSDKKTLFVYPVQYGRHAQNVPHNRQQWVQQEFYGIFVATFQRFDFVTLPESTDLHEFLSDASAYMDAHAKEMVQKRKEEDGRIGETLVTLEDLKKTIQHSYLFVPTFTKVKQEKNKDGDVFYQMEFELDIYRTLDGEKVTTLEVGPASLGVVFGALMNITAGAFDKNESAFRNTVTGIFEDAKTQIRKMDEFALKALITMADFNSFHFDLGKDFGVRLDGRYKVWRLNADGERVDMLAFGKVREIEDNTSRAQMLIGKAGWGDQVVESAAIGLNIIPVLGASPLELKGFDQFSDGVVYRLPEGGNNYGAITYALPEDAKGYRASIGVSLEYNLAWLLGVSELYLVAEGDWMPVSNLMVFSGMGGIEKKIYFRRLAVFGMVKAGVIGVNFMEVEIKDSDHVDADDGRVFGIAGDLGAELLITPNIALQGRLGWYGFPSQTVITAVDQNGDLHQAQVRSVGLTYKAALIIML